MTAPDAILAALHNKPRSCIHQLSEATGMTRSTMRYALVELQKAGLIRRTAEVKGDYVYELVDESVMSDKEASKFLPDLFGLDEETARTRVSMLKNMKARLITEWHPILDTFLRDYERGLRIVELARCGPDDIDEILSGD